MHAKHLAISGWSPQVNIFVTCDSRMLHAS